jgi:hypothetical protein
MSTKGFFDQVCSKSLFTFSCLITFIVGYVFALYIHPMIFKSENYRRINRIQGGSDGYGCGCDGYGCGCDGYGCGCDGYGCGSDGYGCGCENGKTEGFRNRRNRRNRVDVTF